MDVLKINDDDDDDDDVKRNSETVLSYSEAVEIHEYSKLEDTDSMDWQEMVKTGGVEWRMSASLANLAPCLFPQVWEHLGIWSGRRCFALHGSLEIGWHWITFTSWSREWVTFPISGTIQARAVNVFVSNVFWVKEVDGVKKKCVTFTRDLEGH